MRRAAKSSKQKMLYWRTVGRVGAKKLSRMGVNSETPKLKAIHAVVPPKMSSHLANDPSSLVDISEGSACGIRGFVRSRKDIQTQNLCGYPG
jgi:hypothetical protein